MFRKSRRHGIVIRIKRRQVRTQCHPCGTRECCHIDNQLRRLFIGQSQSFAKHKSTFGIGIANFDGQAFSRLENIAGTKGIARDGIFNGRNEYAQSYFQLRTHDQLRQTQHIGGPAHILLHQQHARRRLDVEAARIKTHTFAHQRDLGMFGIAPDEINQPRCPR
jgi:hypothetical protein